MVRAVTGVRDLLERLDASAEHAPNAELLRAAARTIRILKLEAGGSLGSNLCPDHRDKQAGKPCLACEIERLERGASVRP